MVLSVAFIFTYDPRVNILSLRNILKKRIERECGM